MAKPKTPKGFSTGLIPRDYRAHPSGYVAAAPTFPDELLIPEIEWKERLAEQKAKQASLLHLRESNYDTLKSLDQDGLGLCWAFSTTKAVMYLRAIMGEPGMRLSAWYVAGIINRWRDEGGWGAASLAFIAKTGVPSESHCPSYKASYDTPETQADAAKHKVTEWWDGTESRDRNRSIMISCFLLGLPPVLDLNWLSHSMAGCYLESIDPLVVYCDNSWNDIDQYGPKGLYKLTASKAIPDGLVVPRVTMAT